MVRVIGATVILEYMEMEGAPSSCASSRLARMAFAFSGLSRPVIPRSARMDLSLRACACLSSGVPLNYLLRTLRMPHVVTKD